MGRQASYLFAVAAELDLVYRALLAEFELLEQDNVLEISDLVELHHTLMIGCTKQRKIRVNIRRSNIERSLQKSNIPLLNGGPQDHPPSLGDSHQQSLILNLPTEHNLICMIGTNQSNLSLNFSIVDRIPRTPTVLLLLVLILGALGLLAHHGEKTLLMGNDYLTIVMVITSVVYQFIELIEFVQVERFFMSLLLLHQIRVIFIYPLHATITIHEDYMFLSQDEICENLTLEITLEVVTNHLFFGIGGKYEHCTAIASVDIVYLVPGECFIGCASGCRYFTFFSYPDILL